MSLAVPSSWVAVNFAQQNLQEAIKQIGLHGVSPATLAQELQPLQENRAVYAEDTKSTDNSPGHYATNVFAYCMSSGTYQTGGAVLAILRQATAAGLQQIGAQHLIATNAEIGRIPGVRSTYTISKSSAGTLYVAQLVALPKPWRQCNVKLTAAGPLPSAVLAAVTSTIQYP